MPDVPESALEPRLQRLIVNARVAFAQGDCDYVLEVCREILKQHVGCVEVRRLQREAQLKRHGGRGGIIERARGTVTGASLLLSANKTPGQQIEAADHVLAIDPHNGAALRLLATAAAALDLPETAIFAWECLRDVRPEDSATLLGLGAAYLAENRTSEALALAERVMRLRPQDPTATDLMRRASVADTMRKGHWNAGGDYREKLRGETTAGESQPKPPQHESIDGAGGEAGHGAAPTLETRLEAARASVRAQPHDPEARLRLGELYLESGDAGRAAPEFQQAYRHARTRIAAAIGLGQVFQLQRQWDLAAEQFEEAKRALTEMDEAKKKVCYELGRCLVALGRSEDAIAEFKSVYRFDVGFRDVAERVEAHYRENTEDRKG